MTVLFQSLYTSILAQIADDLFTYYIDSNASVLGSGSKASPFKYLSDLPELVEGDSVGLAYGSEWKGYEGLDTAIDNIRFGAYGDDMLPRPIIDGSKFATSFTKTGGQTNVYQFEGDLTELTGNWINVFEDDNYLVNVPNIGTCDSTPGSYYLADHDGGPQTIYIHTSNSSNPSSNGKVYDYTGCSMGLKLRGQNSRISNIQAGKHSSNTSLQGGPFCIIQNCLLFKTGRHSSIAGAGSQYIDCVFDDLYWGPYFGGGYVVFFDNVFNNEECIVFGCQFLNDKLERSGVSIDSHGNSGKLAKVTIHDCYFEKVDSGIGCQNVAYVEGYDCNFVEVPCPACPFGDFAYIHDCTQTNVTATVNGQVFAVLSNNNQEIHIENCVSNIAKARAFFLSTVTGGIATINLNAFHGGPGGGFPIELIRMGDGTLTVYDNELADDNGQYAYNLGLSGGTVALTSDRNLFSPANLTWIINGDTYNFAQYKTLTGQDANSIAA